MQIIIIKKILKQIYRLNKNIKLKTIETQSSKQNLKKKEKTYTYHSFSTTTHLNHLQLTKKTQKLQL